jgi:hypothetical protein
MHFIVNIQTLLLRQHSVLQAHQLQSNTAFDIMYANM